MTFLRKFSSIFREEKIYFRANAKIKLHFQPETTWFTSAIFFFCARAIWLMRASFFSLNAFSRFCLLKTKRFKDEETTLIFFNLPYVDVRAVVQLILCTENFKSFVQWVKVKYSSSQYFYTVVCKTAFCHLKEQIYMKFRYIYLQTCLSKKNFLIGKFSFFS